LCSWLFACVVASLQTGLGEQALSNAEGLVLSHVEGSASPSCFTPLCSCHAERAVGAKHLNRCVLPPTATVIPAAPGSSCNPEVLACLCTCGAGRVGGSWRAGALLPLSFLMSRRAEHLCSAGILAGSPHREVVCLSKLLSSKVRALALWVAALAATSFSLATPHSPLLPLCSLCPLW